MRCLLFHRAAGLAFPAFAVAPISYDMTHPGNGSYPVGTSAIPATMRAPN